MAVSNEQVVRDFIAAWSRLNADEIVAFFTPGDGGLFRPRDLHESVRDDVINVTEGTALS